MGLTDRGVRASGTEATLLDPKAWHGLISGGFLASMLGFCYTPKFVKWLGHQGSTVRGFMLVLVGLSNILPDVTATLEAPMHSLLTNPKPETPNP